MQCLLLYTISLDVGALQQLAENYMLMFYCFNFSANIGFCQVMIETNVNKLL